MFAVVAIALGFATYNLGLPLTLQSAFYPVLGEAVWSRFGHVIEAASQLEHLEADERLSTS